jgi:hypothetical protein
MSAWRFRTNATDNPDSARSPIFRAGPICFPLRDRLHGVDTQRSIPEENTMPTTIAVTKEVTTLINVLTVEPENLQKLILLLREH